MKQGEILLADYSNYLSFFIVRKFLMACPILLEYLFLKCAALHVLLNFKSVHVLSLCKSTVFWNCKQLLFHKDVEIKICSCCLWNHMDPIREWIIRWGNCFLYFWVYLPIVFYTYPYREPASKIRLFTLQLFERSAKILFNLCSRY